MTTPQTITSVGEGMAALANSQAVSLRPDLLASLDWYLRHDQRVSALVDMISPGFNPPVSIPPANGRITIAMVSNPRFMTLTGASGMGQMRVQVNCWARTPQVAAAVKEAVRHCLDGFKGLMGDHEINSAMLLDERSSEEPSPGMEQQMFYLRSVDVEFMYQETPADSVPLLI